MASGKVPTFTADKDGKACTINKTDGTTLRLRQGDCFFTILPVLKDGEYFGGKKTDYKFMNCSQSKLIVAKIGYDNKLDSVIPGDPKNFMSQEDGLLNSIEKYDNCPVIVGENFYPEQPPASAGRRKRKHKKRTLKKRGLKKRTIRA
jgi:hypothetical protein